MNNIPDLASTMVFAEECHRGHVDKGGGMYILHPLNVMRQMDSETEKIVGVFHDVVEDTLITLQDLRQKGYSEEIVDAIDCLTKRDDERYEDFIERCKQNPIALKVRKKKFQQLLRHKTQATTEIYLKRIDNDLASAVRLLEQRDTQRETQTKKEASLNRLTP